MKRALKIFRFLNLPLVARILLLQRAVGRRGGKNVFVLLDSTPVSAKGRMSRETVDAYVGPVVRLGGKLGLLDTCLTRSVVRCVMHRRNGIDSRVAFGLRKDGGLLQGHCWVVGEEPKPAPGGDAPFQDIVVYPER